MNRWLLFALVIFSFSAHAAPVTIDFENVASGTVGSAGTGSFFEIEANGFRFSAAVPAASSFQVVEQSPGDNALSASVFCDNCAIPLYVSRIDGSTFSYFGGDVSGSVAGDPAFIHVSGVLDGGGSASGPVGTGDWLNIQELQFLVFNGGAGLPPGVISITVDDLVVEVVPLPPAILFLFSALASLRAFSRPKAA